MSVKDSFYLDAHRQCPKNRDKGVTFSKPSKTEQSHRETCDVINVVKRYAAAGYRQRDFIELGKYMMSLAHEYMDTTIAGDMLSVHEKYLDAEQMFIDNVPAQIRARFNNKPIEFYKFASDPANEGAVRQMFADIKNYAAPRTDQLIQAVEQTAENKNK